MSPQTGTALFIPKQLTAHWECGDVLLCPAWKKYDRQPLQAGNFQVIPKVFVARLPLSKLPSCEIISILNGKKNFNQKVTLPIHEV